MSWYYDDFDHYDDPDDSYDDFTLADYEMPPTALTIEGPIQAMSRRGDIGREWWGRQWVQAMNNLGMDGRLQRGKTYARNGSVQRIHISEGMVYADVQGNRAYPYRTAIELKLFTDEEWARALDALRGQALYVAKLLAGEMPQDIEQVFQEAGLSLFPNKRKDISFECSCPDWGDPCKHAAAVYYLVAEQLDSDPFILFHLRGRRRELLLQALNQTSGSAGAESVLEARFKLTAGKFWRDDVPQVIRQKPNRQDIPFALRQLGTPPDLKPKDVRVLYNLVADEAWRWLGFDG
ncbi:MAG: SWIM zinc finger family protein [Chloroflexota bacterium]